LLRACKWLALKSYFDLDAASVAVLGTLGVLVAVALSSLSSTSGLGVPPPFNEGTARGLVHAAAGISLAESNKLGTKAEEDDPLSDPTGQEHGLPNRPRPSRTSTPAGVNASEIEVGLLDQGRSEEPRQARDHCRPTSPRRSRTASCREQVFSTIEENPAAFPGVATGIGQPIWPPASSISCRASAAGSPSKIFGDFDPGTLRTLAEQHRARRWRASPASPTCRSSNRC
jgi:Cu/Ag efflux pump CusA